MDTIATKTSFDLQLAQIASVVKDIKAAETFFREAIGMRNFSASKIELVSVTFTSPIAEDLITSNKI